MSTVNVVTYNILTPHYVSGHSYLRDPAHLNEEYRFNLIQSELKSFIDVKRPIICLQEVCREWYDRLIPFMEKNDYAFYFAKGNNFRSGFMGVAMAWPRSLYEVEEIHMATPCELIPKHPIPEEGYLTSYLPIRLKKWLYPEDKNVSDWKYAATRWQDAIIAKLTWKENGNQFVIGTYHMPCAFTRPLVMQLHVTALQKCMNRMSASDLPAILCGDFNIKPDSSHYKYLTTGDGHVDYPDAHHNLRSFIATECPNWKSAYSPHPRFTNRTAMTAWTKEPQFFEGTLDYVFHNGLFQTVETLPTRGLDQLPAPKYLPTEGIPSDHLPLGASFKFSPTPAEQPLPASDSALPNISKESGSEVISVYGEISDEMSGELSDGNGQDVTQEM